MFGAASFWPQGTIFYNQQYVIPIPFLNYSSMVVEDLTKWKAALINRNEELQSSLQALFNETYHLHQNHQQTLL